MERRPLVGDKKGRYRIQVVGNSGSGKSTLSKELSSILGVPHFSLDSIYWQPGWKTTPPDEFRAKLENIIHDNEESGWVMDGEYARLGGAVVTEYATDVIWLDPPLILYFPRVLIRTFRRLFGFEPSCSPGCREMFYESFLTKESILWWCLTNHAPTRKRWEVRLPVMGLGEENVPVEDQKLRRIGGWGSELREWLGSVKRFLRR
ncbi:hypothetical protein E1B28_005654 [Marasmius oreades]|uniref:Adenylate kinase n=1 Tax=Marasmius oreades TaxID=181124 RepID=A0A9P7UVU4_9AGAR|nr:uncharacterized protein E1B28_005654 [Marasmius oreades]KAG7094846.1 hypothetical protein E1B28_005654 [Marasmius oreades]